MTEETQKELPVSVAEDDNLEAAPKKKRARRARSEKNPNESKVRFWIKNRGSRAAFGESQPEMLYDKQEHRIFYLHPARGKGGMRHVEVDLRPREADAGRHWEPVGGEIEEVGG